MPHLDASLLEHGSLLLVLAALLAAGMGAPIPEDLTLLMTGALIHRGLFGAPEAVAVCLAGVLAGDLVLFTLGGRLGRAALRLRRLEKLRNGRWRRVEELFERHGYRLVFAARFIGGLRATTFAVAGAHGMPARRFLAVDALAASLSVPLMLGLGYFFSDRLDRVEGAVGHAQTALLVVALAIVIALLARSHLRQRPR